MKTRKLRLIALALLVLLVFVPTTAVSAAIPSPTSDFYVADYADVLDSDLEAYIIEKNISLYENTGAQIVVVTVDYLDGMEIEDYAYTLFNQWKIGSAQKQRCFVADGCGRKQSLGLAGQRIGTLPAFRRAWSNIKHVSKRRFFKRQIQHRYTKNL